MDEEQEEEEEEEEGEEQGEESEGVRRSQEEGKTAEEILVGEKGRDGNDGKSRRVQRRHVDVRATRESGKRTRKVVLTQIPRRKR